MNYPVWVVPTIGTPWVIGMIAIFHVMISHFAVGGGIYLALARRKIIVENRQDWMPLLKKHAQFFMLVTGVFGTLSGVGIWFAIGLVNPSATSALIHNFVFGWAIEWLFFAVELASALVFYYSWDRISDKLHLQVAYVYAISSICTMVIINGILTFMLTPGHTWLSSLHSNNETLMFWYAFFNPTYWPSLMLRLLAASSLCGVWALVSFARLEQSPTRDDMIKWSVTWLVPAFLLMPIGFFWYKAMVPAENQHLLQLGIATIGSGAFTQITRIVLISIMASSTIAAIAYFFAYQSPKDFTLGHAVALLVVALAATASTEYAREAIRKPYVIGSYMYSNSIRVQDIAKFNNEGYLANSIWAPKEGPSLTPMKRGEFVFRGECMSCHTLDGYRGIKGLLASRDSNGIGNVLTMLHDRTPGAPYHSFMPPLAATPAEIEDLKIYLCAVSHKKMLPPAVPGVAPATAVAPPAPGALVAAR